MNMNEKNNLETDLDPEVIKVRDKIISKIGDKPLEEVNTIIKKLLNEQMDEVKKHFTDKGYTVSRVENTGATSGAHSGATGKVFKWTISWA